MCVCLDWTDWEGEQHRGFSQVKEYNTLNHVLPAVTLTLESDQTAASLTQSVVNGAPLAIRFLTSSSWPFRAASSRRFPRSTNDIWHTQTFRSLNISLHFIPHEHADSASVHRYMFTFMVNLTVSCRTTDGSEPAQRQTAEQSDTLLYDWAGRFCCSWNWRQEKHNQTSVTEAGRQCDNKDHSKMTSALWNIKPHWDLININYHTHLFLHWNLWKTVFSSELMVENSRQVYWCRF